MSSPLVQRELQIIRPDAGSKFVAGVAADASDVKAAHVLQDKPYSD